MTERKEVFMIEPLLNVEDLMRMFHISRVTLYRWIALARKGEGHFPLPVFGRKQKLCWHRDAVEQFCKTQPANNGLAGE
jgi:predicted DNA-binding transcriptional regulator AlpA